MIGRRRTTLEFPMQIIGSDNPTRRQLLLSSAAAALLSRAAPVQSAAPTVRRCERYSRPSVPLGIRYVTQSPIDFDVNRVCTHIFNTEEEIDRLVEALRRRGARA
jgi:selenocysteine lyase/cysteine desulfurase